MVAMKQLGILTTQRYHQLTILQVYLVSLVRATTHSSQEKANQVRVQSQTPFTTNQVKDPIFGKARKGKSSSKSESKSSSKGSKKSKLFGKAKDGSTHSPTTDALSSTAKSWKGISSSEDGSTIKDTRVYEEEEFPYWHYHTNNKDTRTSNVMNVACSKLNPCQDTNTHFCKMSSGSCMSDKEGVCTEYGSSFCKQSLEPVCGCDGIVYGNSCQANYLYGINVQCVLDSEEYTTSWSVL